MNLEIITNQLCNLSKAVGHFIRNEINNINSGNIEIKGEHNYVTYVDKKAEAMIVEALSQILPEAGFIAEESPELKTNETYNWIIDPLDGTTNFIHSIPIFSISIALMHEQEVIAGVIYEINNDECFYAWKGSKAYLNGSPIKIKDTEKLDDALIATGFPYTDYERLDPYLAFFKELVVSTRGVRRLGSAAVDLAYVACGRFDSFYEYGLNPWDVAAGVLIVERAGGIVSDFSGDKNYIFGKEIIASGPNIYTPFLELTQSYFGKLR